MVVLIVLSCILCVVSLSFSVLLLISSIKEKGKRNKKITISAENKQKFTESNITQLCFNNQGESMDNCEIYHVPYFAMGIY